MKRFGRRTLMVGAGTLGALALAYGGSAAVCSGRMQQTALLRGLFVALDDLVAPRRIGQVYLAERGAQGLWTDIEHREDLFGLALLPGVEDRRSELRRTVRGEFARGEAVLVDRWLVARTEALLAGIAVA